MTQDTKYISPICEDEETEEEEEDDEIDENFSGDWGVDDDDEE
ncbi:MAG: hypothetical protein ABID67_01630 [Candidatus Nealsonbacteria bacterium]